jgi:hypothetical protein
MAPLGGAAAKKFKTGCNRDVQLVETVEMEERKVLKDGAAAFH